MVVRGVGRSALSSVESLGLLRLTRRGRLITTLGALPAAEPVPFVADGSDVVVRVGDPDSIRDRDVLSLQVDDIDVRSGAGWSVLVTGSARRIEHGHPLVGRLCASATDDWLDQAGQLVLLADPLIRGVAIRPAADPAWDTTSSSDQVAEALRVAVALAARAPSVHGVRPWRWEVTDAGLDLHADLGGSSLAAGSNPDGRAWLIGCGASLQHARTALVAAGWGVRTLVSPDPDDPDHLARLRLLGRVPPQDRDLRLAEAATHRRAEHPPFGTEPVLVDRLAELVAAASFEDAMLHLVEETDHRFRSAFLADRAARARPADPANQFALLLADSAGEMAGDAAGAGASLVGGPGAASTLAVLCTNGDDRRARLRAGEATARVLLVAEVHGLAVCPLVSPMEIPEVRARLRDLLPGLGEPQLVLRIGAPATGIQPPPAPPSIA